MGIPDIQCPTGGITVEFHKKAQWNAGEIPVEFQRNFRKEFIANLPEYRSNSTRKFRQILLPNPSRIRRNSRHPAGLSSRETGEILTKSSLEIHRNKAHIPRKNSSKFPGGIQVEMRRYSA